MGIRKFFVKYFKVCYLILTLLICVCLPASIFLYQYQNAQVQAEQQAIDKTMYFNQYVAQVFNRLTDKATHTVQLISHGDNMHRYIAHPNSENKARLEKLWYFMMGMQENYNQIRLLNNKGVELIRVDYNSRTEKAKVVTDLQDKSQRHYFLQAQTLKNDEVGVYAMDLEMEHKRYIQPYTPAFRIITPVIHNQQPYGFIVINMDVPFILERLLEANIHRFTFSIYDPKGFYIISDEKEKLYGQLLPQRSKYNLAVEYPEFWEKINTVKEGVYKTDQVIYVFKEINFGIKNSQDYYIQVSKINRNYIKKDQAILFKSLMVEIGVIIGILLIIAMRLYYYFNNIRKMNLEKSLIYAGMNGVSAVIVTDPNNHIIKVNQQLTKITGYMEEEVLGKNPSIFQSGLYSQEFYQALWDKLLKEGVWDGEITNRSKDGHLITQLSCIRVVKEKEKILHYVASFIDITSRKKLEDRLREMSEKDPLTRLWNRRMFDGCLDYQIKKMQRYPHESYFSLAMLDIDFFKKVNDTYGHPKGDKVIKHVADVLTQNLRSVDIIARIGGEEYAVIMPQTSLENALALIDRQRLAIHKTSDIGVTISAGVVEMSKDYAWEDIYKSADDALYKAKQSGRNRVCTIDSIKKTEQ